MFNKRYYQLTYLSNLFYKQFHPTIIFFLKLAEKKQKSLDN